MAQLAATVAIADPRRAVRARRTPMVPVVWEMPAVAALALLVILQENADLSTQEFMNYAAPVCLSGILCYAALRMILLDSAAIWTPLFWLRIATSVYFGFGSIVPLIVNADTRIYIESYFILYASDMVKVNAVIAAGTAVVLASNIVFEEVRALMMRDRLSAIAPDRIARAGRVGFLFLAVGGSIKYLLIIPNEVAGSPVVIPGLIVNLALCLPVGIALLTIWSMYRTRFYLFAVVALVAFEFCIGMLELTKLDALLPLLAFIIGVLTVKATLTRLAIIAIGLALLFNLMQPWMQQARNQALATYGTMVDRVPLLSRAEFLLSYFDDSPAQAVQDDVQQSMIRLSFINAAAFVISRYDRGVPGDSLRNVMYSFIPRILWPDKPEVLVQSELASLASGTIGNSISAGYYPDVYWNLGWIGLLLLVPVGVAFNIASRFALDIVRRGDWIYVPVAFLNLKIAIAVDSFYVGLVGTFAISFGAYLLLRILPLEKMTAMLFAPMRRA